MSDYKDIVDLLKTLSSPAKLLPKAEPLKSAMKSPLKGPSSPKSISFGIANDVSTLPKSTFMFSPEAAQPFIPSVTSNAALAPATSTFNTLATPAVSTLNPTATTFGSSFEFGKTIGAFGDSSKSPKKESSSSFESSLGSFKSSFANEEKSKVSSVPVAEPAKSVFAFGGPTDALKPAYTFGNTAAAKPLNGTEEAKPGFNFSSSEGAKPTISFGSNNSTFGSSDTTFGSSTTTFVPSSFGSSAPSGSFQFQFGAAPAPLPVSNEQGEDEGIPEGEEESFTNARANNEMIKTGKGEENETCLLEQRAKLFAVHKDEGNENLGIGVFKINKDNASGKCRVLFRLEGSGKVLLNSHVSALLSTHESGKKVMQMVVFGNDNEKKLYMLMIKDPLITAKAHELIQANSKG